MAGRDFYLGRRRAIRASGRRAFAASPLAKTGEGGQGEKKSCVQKGEAAKSTKRGLRCPNRLYRLRKGGAQRCECPVCGRHSCDTTRTSLPSSRPSSATMQKVIALIFLDCPDWVISWMLGIDRKTARFWRGRCLGASQKRPMETMLPNRVWIDEMRFAPTRAGGFADGVRATCAGKMAKDACLEIAFDSGGGGFRKLYSEKLGMPTRDTAFDALGRRIGKGSKTTHDGAPCRSLLVRRPCLEDDWRKFAPGDKKCEDKMRPMSSRCSYLRHSLESHCGIKSPKLEAYANFFPYRWMHVRKHGLEDAISFMASRISGTPKSHNCSNSFKKLGRGFDFVPTFAPISRILKDFPCLEKCTCL